MSRFTGAMLLDTERLAHLDSLETRLTAFEAEMISAIIAEGAAALDTAADADFWPRAGSWLSAYRPYEVKDGVLHIPVKGMLLNDFPYAMGGWATGYEYIRAAMERGLADGSVQSIALRVDSGGGMVTGCFDCADDIYKGRATKPVVAYVNDHAYSAAYALASSANKIVVSRTGGVGSIGVLTYHMDVSGLYEMAGVKKTYIFKGKHKVDGNEAEPLPKDVKARIEARLDVSYDEFVRTVARNRGLKEQAVRDTEALTYTASTAIEAGLADRVGTHGDAFLADVAETSNDGDDEMANAQAEKTFTQADIDAAVTAAKTEAAAATEIAVASVAKAATDAERARISSILGSEEAKNRPTAAHELAFSLDMAADGVKAILAKLPTEAPKGAVRDGITRNFKAEQENGKPEILADVKDEDPTPGARGTKALDHMKAMGL